MSDKKQEAYSENDPQKLMAEQGLRGANPEVYLTGTWVQRGENRLHVPLQVKRGGDTIQ